MSDMKCPICQNNLHKINIVVSTCTNDKCKLWGSSIPNLVLEALAQEKQDLERTRKALDVAKDALKWIHETYSLGMGYEAAIMEKCEFALEEITALEQKDVK